jgi:rhamnogalacturonyl hydrolase YesR
VCISAKQVVKKFTKYAEDREPSEVAQEAMACQFAVFLNAGESDGATERAVEALECRAINVSASGNVSLRNVCQVAGLGYGRDGSYRYYMSEPVISNDPKGVGPFIMAGIQVSEMLSAATN